MMPLPIQSPEILFYSGLDWSSAKHCIEILHKLTKEGKTVICSIHQPSMSLLRFFHHTYILCEGRCIYQGSVSNLIKFLSDLKYECPTHHNPVEYGKHKRKKVLLFILTISNIVSYFYHIFITEDRNLNRYAAQ